MRNYLFLLLVCIGCRQTIDPIPNNVGTRDTTLFAGFSDPATVAAKGDSSLPDKIVAFAKTQIGVRYKYCSMTPEGGFDCSGFVNYVFNHFNIKVPRSSVDFTNAGEDVALNRAQPADLILFTGTDPHKKVVGHIGIIVTNDNGDINFIQATSGMAYSVVISPLDKYYMSRFVKVIRIRK
jgi:cell wall-associated NlpC family hydrolase